MKCAYLIWKVVAYNIVKSFSSPCGRMVREKIRIYSMRREHSRVPHRRHKCVLSMVTTRLHNALCHKQMQVREPAFRVLECETIEGHLPHLPFGGKSNSRVLPMCRQNFLHGAFSAISLRRTVGPLAAVRTHRLKIGWPALCLQSHHGSFHEESNSALANSLFYWYRGAELPRNPWQAPPQF